MPSMPTDDRFNAEFLRFMASVYGEGNHPYSNKKILSNDIAPELKVLMDEVMKF